MAQLGTFADEMVVHENSLVRLNGWDNLKAAALISCGISTGFGAAVDRAKVKPGETVVVAGCGGVGSGAIQGARIAGARHIVAVDPVQFKLDRAKEIGATHTATSLAEVPFLLPELTMGRNADVVILTPGVLRGEMIAEAAQCGSKDARIVAVAISPFDAMDVKLNLFNLAMFNQTVMGTVFGSQSPRVQVPNLLNLYESGQLQIDELITQEYTLDQVQQGYEDQAAGTIVRGVVKFDS
jgi:S-(hydroxymethyl)glutathione dehydrogenase/alcohol dehydrogenase